MTYAVETLTFDLDTRSHSWYTPSAFPEPIPDEMGYWLFLPGSLTEALRQRTDNFSVAVIEETLINSTDPSLNAAHTKEKAEYFSRKVALKNHQEIWVMAHTLIPTTSLKQGLAELSTLQERPLGELLFADDTVRKSPTEITHFDTLWGRRSRYWLREQPLLVTEYFLPELIRQS
ncbi:chorismate--pyruvate lyase family protein [Reinekea marina]|uniref:Probable chorismate pyruvate-lyase n=1 Tax=Reinekea marina TaxID=1310421 RepID=A0ABV7WRQ7_9GAMM